MTPIIVLWVYIVLLVAGGVAGFLKAKSKISLIASVVFAALLVLYPLGIVRNAIYPDILITVLLVFFGIRFAKTRRFMPAGLMAILSIMAIVLRHIGTV